MSIINSPLVLIQSVFPNAIVDEGESLSITCTNRNIPNITTLQILDPNGAPTISTSAVPGDFSVPNITRASAGNYTCVVMSTIDNSTVNATSRVIVQCKLSLI